MQNNSKIIPPKGKGWINCLHWHTEREEMTDFESGALFVYFLFQNAGSEKYICVFPSGLVP